MDGQSQDMTRGAPIGVLYREELKAMMRGRFAWLGAGVILLAVGGLATVGTQDTWLDGYGIIAYGLVPLAFIPFTAIAIASPRANRFVESVFTAPVDCGTWLAAKVLVLLTLAAAYYASLVPMMLVYAAHVGIPPLLEKFLVWTPGSLLAGVAVGTLIGVLFIGRTIAPPAAAAVGVLLVYAGLVPLQELMVAQGNGGTRTGHLTLLSPAVLLKNALGFSLVASSIPATTTRTWISLAVLVAAAVLLAVWVFVRAQGVETWEASRAQRWTLGVALAAATLLPVTIADTNYDVPAPRRTAAPAIRGIFSRGGSSLALTDPGESPPARCCGTILNRDQWPLGTDHTARRDLWILLPVEASQTVADLRIQIHGENGLQIQTDPGAVAIAAAHLETRTYPNDSGPVTTEGHHIATGLAARIPITLTPTNPWDIGGDRYPLTVIATYRVDGEGTPHTLSARAAVDAQVSSAIYEMGAASAMLPLFCFGAAFARWRRTR